MTAPAVLVLALSRDELADLLRHVVRNELAEARAAEAAPPAPRLTIDALAHVEGCSRATIRRLICDGGPVHYVGASPRIDLAEWRAWCGERGRRGTTAAPPRERERLAAVRLLSRGSNR